MQTNVKTRSGNRTIITMDGVQVGLLQSVRMSDDYAPEAASGIGDIHVQEWVPTQARHTLSVSKMVLETEKIRSLGIFAENGDVVLQGLVFDVIVQSRDDGTVLRTYRQCSYASGDVDVTKHQITMASGQLYACDVSGVGI